MTEAMGTPRPVVEVDSRKPIPQRTRQAIEDDPDLRFRDEVPPIATGSMVRESEWSHGDVQSHQ